MVPLWHEGAPGVSNVPCRLKLAAQRSIQIDRGVDGIDVNA